jgi:acetyltransferase-like isoleucine patch superfamily enzyme
MRVFGRVAGLLLGLANRVAAALRTADARAQASLGPRTRLGAEGQVINIAARPGAIGVGADGMVRGELLTFAHAGRIRVGDWFYLGPHSTIWSSDPQGITIGDRVLISMRVSIHDTNSHPLDPEARFKQTEAVITKGHPAENPGIRSAPIVIGDDVWIGMGATIFKGVTIGNRAIISALAVVSSDVPEDGFVPTAPSAVRKTTES